MSSLIWNSHICVLKVFFSFQTVMLKQKDKYAQIKRDQTDDYQDLVMWPQSMNKNVRDNSPFALQICMTYSKMLWGHDCPSVRLSVCLGLEVQPHGRNEVCGQSRWSGNDAVLPLHEIRSGMGALHCPSLSEHTHTHLLTGPQVLVQHLIKCKRPCFRKLSLHLLYRYTACK